MVEEELIDIYCFFDLFSFINHPCNKMTQAISKYVQES